MPFTDAVVRLAPQLRFIAPIGPSLQLLAMVSPEMADADRLEVTRQEVGIDLIASQNLVSPFVLAAGSSAATNKYAEGYPGKRYYGGCQYVDLTEMKAMELACQLFGAAYANVPPHPGSSANEEVYTALLNPGDQVLAMAIEAGGHLTHGNYPSETAVTYRFKHYGVDPTTGLIDYNVVESLALEQRPAMIVAGASAYSRDIDFDAFRRIADQVGALLFVDMAHPAGLIAAGCLTSPIKKAHVTSTTTHKTLRGPRGGMILLGEDMPDPRGRTTGKGGRVQTLSERINSRVMPGRQGGPLMHIILAKAIAFQEALQDPFRDYAQQVIRNAQMLADAMLQAGYHVVSGGTDNHVFLVDLRTKHPELTGKKAERLLGEAGLTVNANMVPGETRTPFTTSGLRIGTPTITTRGMKEPEMLLIAGWIDAILSNPEDGDLRERILGKVLELTAQFPFYREG